MNARIIEANGVLSVRIESDSILIYDLTSAIDFLETVFMETGLQRVVIDRHAFAEDFFLFGLSQVDYVLQLLQQYGTKIAVIGDFMDFPIEVIDILNSPANTSLFLVNNENSAVTKLSETA